MSLDQSINHGKDHRKQYHGSKAIDKTCRNHGGCDWCQENRQHKYDKKEEAMKEREREYETERGENFNDLTTTN